MQSEFGPNLGPADFVRTPCPRRMSRRVTSRYPFEMARKIKLDTPGQLAAALDHIGARIASNDLSFDLQLELCDAEEALVRMKHIDGLRLLNRISMMHNTENGTKHVKYELVRNAVAQMDPLDPVKDSAAVRTLASELRKGSG